MRNRQLYRSRQHKVLGGVMAGLAEYFGHDIVLWRVIAIALFILTGFMPGVLVYVLAWIIIPEAPEVTPLSPDDYTVVS